MLKSCLSSMCVKSSTNNLISVKCMLRTNRFNSPKRYFTGMKNLITERGKAEENIYFLKKQREQLMSLREKILNEKKVISDVLDEVQDQITRLRKQTQTQQENALSGAKTSADKAVDIYNQNSKF